MFDANPIILLLQLHKNGGGLGPVGLQFVNDRIYSRNDANILLAK